MESNLIEYGAKLTAVQLQETLDHMFLRNAELNRQGKRVTPICIWGKHGLKGWCLPSSVACTPTPVSGRRSTRPGGRWTSYARKQRKVGPSPPNPPNRRPTIFENLLKNCKSPDRRDLA